MNTYKEKKITEDLKLEIEISKLVVKELTALVNKYKKQVEKQKEKIGSEQSKYENLNDAQEAFGYGDITEKEFSELQDYFNEIEEKKTPKELYLQYLKSELCTESKSLDDLRKELKTANERS